MSFERPSITIIDRRIRADMEANMDAVPVVRRGSVLAGIARGQAGASHELHGHLNWNYRQLFPDTAEKPGAGASGRVLRHCQGRCCGLLRGGDHYRG